jgi:DNA-directed RNA polymerase beta' subunit
VISPDVNIEPHEIGIPPIFAKKLTYPEPVTPANFHELRRLVITGPRGYPGAAVVEYEDGNQLSLVGVNFKCNPVEIYHPFAG